MPERVIVGVARWLLTAVVLLPLTGCFGLDETSIWSAELTATPRAGTGRVVLALDAARGPISVGLLRTDQGCGQGTPSSTLAGSIGVTYVAYDVKPGNYSLTYSPSGELRDGDPAEFVVPAGGAAYLGRLVNASNRLDPQNTLRGIHLVRDDLAAAQKALGIEGDQLELAEAIAGGRQLALCAFL